MNLWLVLLNGVAFLSLTVTSFDLLYLHAVGGWGEPERWIELGEIIMLYFWVGLGVLQFITLAYCATRRIK